MSAELSLFLLSIIWIALAFGLGYMLGARNVTRRWFEAQRRPYDQERDG